MGFAAGVSLWTSIWQPRYFRFAHLFFLAAVAVAIWRLTAGRARLALSGAVVLLLLLGWADFWSTLDVAHHPGMRGAMEDIARARDKPGPIIVMRYYQICAAKYYAPRGVKVFLWQPDETSGALGLGGQEVSIRRQGGPAIPASDLISTQETLVQLRAGAWIVNNADEVIFESPAADAVRVPLPSGSEYYYRFLYPVRFGYCVLSEAPP
jgi:hypothetical protein